MPKYTVETSAQYRRDYARMERQGRPMELLHDVVNRLAEGETLPHSRYLTHPLTGNWEGYMECHIMRDWLLVYQIRERELVLALMRTSTHDELFGKQRRRG